MPVQDNEDYPNDRRNYQDFCKTIADMQTSITNIGRLRATTAIARNNRFEAIEKAIVTLEDEIHKLRSVLVGTNGDMQKSILWKLDLLIDCFDRHIKQHEETGNKVWDIISKVLSHAAIAAVGALALFIAQQLKGGL